MPGPARALSWSKLLREYAHPYLLCLRQSVLDATHDGRTLCSLTVQPRSNGPLFDDHPDHSTGGITRIAQVYAISTGAFSFLVRYD